MWRGAGAWSHAPGRCASATTRAANEPDQPHKPNEPDEPDEPDQAPEPRADESFEPNARDSNAPALIVDVDRWVVVGVLVGICCN